MRKGTGMIKIGCNFLSLKDTNVEDFIRIAFDLNLDCVDFHQRAFESPDDPAYLSGMKRLCLRHGLPIGYIGCSPTFVGNRQERTEGVQTCKEAVDLAAFLGSPIIRVFCGTMPEKNGDDDEPWPPMISCYQEIADYAATKGIHVGLQNHPSTGDGMMRIRSETGRENFDFVMDTGQWVGSYGAYHKGETPDVDFYEFMEQTAPHAMYVRTKFYDIDSGVEKLLDYERIVAILKSVNYNGCISIVYEGKEDDRVDQVRKAAAYLRRLLAA